MPTKESTLIHPGAKFFGPNARVAWVNFLGAAALDQATVNYGGFSGLTNSVLAVNRTGVGVYTADLTDLPSMALIVADYVGNVNGKMTTSRSGRTITIRLFAADGITATDLAVTANVMVWTFDEV